MSETQESNVSTRQHLSIDDSAHVTAFVSNLADETWCNSNFVCPVIAEFLSLWGNGITDEETRTRLLRPSVNRVIYTRSSQKIKTRRQMMCAEWLIRDRLPAFLDLVPVLAPHAAAVRAFGKLTSDKTLVILEKIAVDGGCFQSQSTASWASWPAGDAVRASAMEAAMEAAGCAENSLRPWFASWSVMREAALDAAVDAAKYAAWESVAKAARTDVLAPLVAESQQSALRLVDRLISYWKGDHLS